MPHRRLLSYTTDIILHLQKRKGETVDKRFDEKDAHILRICSIASSTSSLVCGVVAFYLFGAISYKKRVFRHQLIMFLIFFDMIKAGVLLIYPSRIETKFLLYYNHNFCEIVGFFTSLAIEGADIAILSFAIHTGLLIFKPNAKVKNGNNLEGGLFKYRYYVYLISFVTPCILLLLLFVNNSGYRPLTTWCYLPQEPRWYRLVLSWIPRYLIVITIVTIYVSIYYYVMRQYSIVGGNFKNIHNVESDSQNPTGWKKGLWTVKNFYKNVKKVTLAILFPELNMYPFMDNDSDLPNDKKKYTYTDLDENGDLVNHGKDEENQHLKPNGIQDNLHKESYHQFQIRRLQIQKQMKSIFIYPISYIFLWSFPFVLQCFEFHDSRSSIVWLNAVLLFFQPFNCTVDTLVFLYRERPWTITPMTTDTSPFERYEYPKWRRNLSWLPFYGLPTPEYNQERHEKKLARQREADQMAALKLRTISNSSSQSSPAEKNKQSNPHDFANILAGDDMDFVRLPRKTGTSMSIQTQPPLSSMQTLSKGPSRWNTFDFTFGSNENNEQSQQYPQQERRRSSKFSWLSSLSGATSDRRRSSGGNTVSPLPPPQQPQAAPHQQSDRAFNSPTTAMFPLSYAMTEITPKSGTNVMTSSTTATTNTQFTTPTMDNANSNSNSNNSSSNNVTPVMGSTALYLRPQQSPTSPMQPDTTIHSAADISSISGAVPGTVFSPITSATQPSTLQSQTRNLSNAFGLARRPSFFDGMHSLHANGFDLNRKRGPFGDENRTEADPTNWNALARDVSERVTEEEDDDMDLLDFLNKGPPV